MKPYIKIVWIIWICCPVQWIIWTRAILPLFWTPLCWTHCFNHTHIMNLSTICVIHNVEPWTASILFSRNLKSKIDQINTSPLCFFLCIQMSPFSSAWHGKLVNLSKDLDFRSPTLPIFFGGGVGWVGSSNYLYFERIFDLLCLILKVFLTF